MARPDMGSPDIDVTERRKDPSHVARVHERRRETWTQIITKLREGHRSHVNPYSTVSPVGGPVQCCPLHLEGLCMRPPCPYQDLGAFPEGTIRLLELWPGEQDTPIECTLRNGTVEEHLTAVSYVWGTCKADHEITLNGSQFLVRPNLFDCLFHLRDERIPRTLWIDAICVNQNDFQERGSQVSLMDQIYGKADAVVAWLGSTSSSSASMLTASPSSIPGFRSMRRMASWMNATLPLGLSRSETENKIALRQWDMIRNAMHAIKSICDREYWTRMWIVQEFILAFKLNLQHGVHEIVWDDFAAWCDLLRLSQTTILRHADAESVDLMKDCLAAITRSRVLDVASDRTKRFQSLDPYPQLNSLMFMYGGRFCADPRDKMIALLSLASNPSTGQRVKTEEMYEMKPRQLFAHVAKVYGFDRKTKLGLIQLVPP